MGADPFVHLHVHSHYSLLDGGATVQNLAKQAKSLGMNSLALTDHGNLYGAIEFYEACKSTGIKPIIGYEAYVAPARRDDRVTRGGTSGEASFHLTMLAQNRQGFQNLVKLASHAFLEGFYYKPRIDRELIEQYNEGIIVLSGCAASEFSSLILGERMDEALKLADWFRKLFDGRFFVEIQNNGLEIQRDCMVGAVEIAKQLDLPLVASCDSHYLCEADAEAHEVLLCINTGKKMSDPNRLRYGSNEFFLKSPEDMYRAFPGHEEAVRRSQEIADMVDIDLDFKTRHFPVFHPPAEYDDKKYLRKLCEDGLAKKYPESMIQAAKDRLDWELGVIEKLGFASYFLIVWDFVRFANEKGIPCGARGSACGAVVSYLLGLSSVDPLTYDLLFERFLDPNRVEAPDIDIDFCQHRREEVIEYVREKYGSKNVAQIITFGTMAARAAIRDVSRALDVPLARADQIAKMIPEVLNITLNKSLETSQELKKEYDNDPQVKQLIDIARRLEGLARNAGTHAAGVVIADRDLTDHIPIQKNGEVVTTQWEMGILEKVGMLKMDFLGLRNLTLLADAIRMITKSRGKPIKLEDIPLDDPATYGLLQRGETKGVFQLESEGIRNLLVRLRPDRFQDIIAVNALYRPGPLGGGMVDKYINVKHGLEKAEYAHSVMKDVLEETYGVMVYQEQVMRILNRLGGIELSNAYKCIKAISKKNFDAIAKYRQTFVENAGKLGLAADKAEEIFGLIEFFAGYGFNKSHSTAYALVAYQTAYLKAHFPPEFMAALLSSELDRTDKLTEHVDDCRRMGLEVLGPDINRGDVGFSVIDGKVQFGAAAIKGVGEKAVEAAVNERLANGPYKSIFDLCERLDVKSMPKSCLENLIKAGAFDSMKARRNQLMHALPKALQAGVEARDAKNSGQGLLFGGEDADTEVVHQSLPDVPEWPDQEKLGYEKELLGVYLSSHPLTEHQSKLRLFRTHTIGDIGPINDRREVVLGGMVESMRVLVSKTGRNANQRYARFNLTDLSGSMSCIMFADQFSEYSNVLKDNYICFVRGEVEMRQDQLSMVVGELIGLESAARQLSGTVWIRLDSSVHNQDNLVAVERILKAHKGSSPVFLEIASQAGVRVRLRASEEFSVMSDDALVRDLEANLASSSVSFGPPIAGENRSANRNGKNGHGQKSYSKAGAGKSGGR